MKWEEIDFDVYSRHERTQEIYNANLKCFKARDKGAILSAVSCNSRILSYIPAFILQLHVYQSKQMRPPPPLGKYMYEGMTGEWEREGHIVLFTRNFMKKKLDHNESD